MPAPGNGTDGRRPADAAGEPPYQVTPRPPFDGKLTVMLRIRLGEVSFVDTANLYSNRNRSLLAATLQRRFNLTRDVAERQLDAIQNAAKQWVAETQKAQTAADDNQVTRRR